MFGKNLAAAVVVVLAASTASAAAPSDKQVQKVIKTVINAIRYNKDDVAAKSVAFEPMAKAIMLDAWDKLSEPERKELVAGVETLIKKLSFPKGRDMFQYLDAVLYGPMKVDGPKVTSKATVVVNRNYKKAEIVIDFVLVEDKGEWKIMDTVMTGESTTAGIHEDQIVPLMKEGGTAAVMKALRDKLAEIFMKRALLLCCAASAGCSAAGNTWVAAGYDARGAEAVKRISVVGWAPTDLTALDDLLGTIASDRIKLRMNYLVYQAGAVPRAWSDACVALPAPPAAPTPPAPIDPTVAPEPAAEAPATPPAEAAPEAAAEPATAAETPPMPIEGVLLIRTLEVASAAGQVKMALLGELYRCTDGALLWRTEARDAQASKDENLAELTRSYIESLGPAVEPYAVPAFQLIRDILEALPDVVLNDDEVMEKIEIGRSQGPAAPVG